MRKNIINLRFDRKKKQINLLIVNALKNVHLQQFLNHIITHAWKAVSNCKLTKIAIIFTKSKFGISTET